MKNVVCRWRQSVSLGVINKTDPNIVGSYKCICQWNMDGKNATFCTKVNGVMEINTHQCKRKKISSTDLTGPSANF